MTRRGIAPLITGLHIANGFHALIFPCFQDAVDVVPLANPGQCSLFDSQQDEVVRENLPPAQQVFPRCWWETSEIVLERADDLRQPSNDSRTTVISYSFSVLSLFIFLYLFLCRDIFPTITGHIVSTCVSSVVSLL